MTGNTFGKMFRVTTCGESYSGCFRKSPDIPKELYGGLLTIVDGVPPASASPPRTFRRSWTSASPASPPWTPPARSGTGSTSSPA